jgi:hypothetical protein
VTSQPARGTLDEAAAALGISHAAVRGRVRRGTLRATRVDGRWLVDLAAAMAGSGRPATGRDQPASGPPATLVDALQTEVAYLRAALEREQQASAELRRMLNLEQQTVAAHAAPHQLPAAQGMPAERAEMPEKAPAVPELVVEIETSPLTTQALKQAGVRGKKQRQKLLDRLAPLWRR